MGIKILHLTLKREWFNLIATAEKSIEYREVKGFWNKRLLNEDGTPKKFNEVHFRNGYGKDKPLIRAEHIRTLKIRMPFNYGPFKKDQKVFAIHLGKLKEVSHKA